LTMRTRLKINGIVDGFVPGLYFEVRKLLREVTISGNFNAVVATERNPRDREMAAAVGPLGIDYAHTRSDQRDSRLSNWTAVALDNPNHPRRCSTAAEPIGFSGIATRDPRSSPLSCAGNDRASRTETTRPKVTWLRLLTHVMPYVPIILLANILQQFRVGN
jgi:hypothetical protein